MRTVNLETLNIHKLSQEQYDREREAGRLDETALYLVPDESMDSGASSETIEALQTSVSEQQESITNLQTSVSEQQESINNLQTSVDSKSTVNVGGNFMSTLNIYDVTKTEYEAMESAGTLDSDVLYLVENEEVDLSNYVDLTSSQNITGAKNFGNAKLIIADTLNFEAAYKDSVPELSFMGENSDEAVRLNNVADPSTSSDATNKSYVDTKIAALHGGMIGKVGDADSAEVFNYYDKNVASGKGSFAAGAVTTAAGNASATFGGGTQTNADYQFAIGKYNSITNTSSSVFVVGVGTAADSRENGFRVDFEGKPYALSTMSSSGADYAEYFEWADGNPNAEDRCGRFVTLDGEKIRYATADDEYILGIVSAEPTIVGDIQSESWRDRYLRDIFGRKIYETVEVEETADKNGIVTPAHTERRWVLNPEYNPEVTYVSREDRPEWDAIGIVGKLVVTDDGSCVVNGYCYPGTDGIATNSTAKTAYRVINRLDDTHVKIFIK